jgi:hypothetical protein
MSQFSDLQETCRWDRQQYREEKKALQLALVQQFNQIYSKKADSMYGWQELCRVMNLSPVPSTVSECMLVSPYDDILIFTCLPVCRCSIIPMSTSSTSSTAIARSRTSTRLIMSSTYPNTLWTPASSFPRNTPKRAGSSNGCSVRSCITERTTATRRWRYARDASRDGPLVGVDDLWFLPRCTDHINVSGVRLSNCFWSS